MRTLAVSTLLVMVVACNSTPATTSQPPDASTTSTPPTTPAATLATTTTGPAPACPDLPAVPGSAAVVGVEGDVDGDGSTDVISTYVDGSAPRLRVDLAAGGSIDVAMEAEESPAGFEPIGAADIDDDGDGEVFATVGAGAYTVLIGVWVLEECDLVRATVGGAPGIFAVGASVSNVAGLSCGGVGDLDVLFAESMDGVEFEGGFSPFELEGAELVQGFGDGGGFHAEEAYALAGFVCGDLTYP